MLVESRDGRTVHEDDIIAALDGTTALLLLPSVLYRSGQLFDIARLTAAAHERNVLVGFDCCHSIGAIPHRFDEWGVDFACWCNYKYLNNGPGGTAGLYVNRRHFGRTPGLAGWWGSNKERQFDMASDFDRAPNAGRLADQHDPGAQRRAAPGLARDLRRSGDRGGAREVAQADALPDGLARGDRPDRRAVQLRHRHAARRTTSAAATSRSNTPTARASSRR